MSHAVATRRERWTSAGKLFLLALLFTAITTLLHELGHFAVPLAFDLPAELRPTSVSGGAEPDSGAPGWMIGAQAAGGPLVTIVMGLIGGALFARDPRRLWALAFAAAAVSRLFVTTGYLGIRLLFAIQGRQFGGTPNFDEHHIATALGVSPLIVSVVATAFLVAVLVWLFRNVGRGSRILFFVALVAGILIGSVAWAALAPPVLASIG